MFENRVICSICLFFLMLPIADGTATPRNLAVVAGDWMAMECRPSNGSSVFNWEVLQATSLSLRGIFVNHDEKRSLTEQYSSRFGTDMDETCSGLLYTNATQLDDAGLYVCHFERSAEPTEQLEFFSAHLIVLESDPFCESNYTVEVNETFTEGDIIWMQCLVNFRGMWSPTFEWKQHTVNDKEEEQMIIHDASAVTLINTRVTTTLNYVYKFSETTYFSCRMLFQRYNGSLHATATNLPEFIYTWKSPTFLSHREQLKTTEEVYIALLPVEVGSLSTTVIIPVGNSAWYLIVPTLLAAVVIFVTLLVGLGILCYVRFRRARDISMIYNASTSSTVPRRRFDIPSSGEYDLTPTATPNIYDRIDGANAEDDVIAQTMASYMYNQCEVQPTQCYSGLMAAMENFSSPYDTLDLYEKMDALTSETDPTASRWNDGSIQMSEEERYTTPVPKRGISESSNPNSSDYLQMVGSNKKSRMTAPSRYFVSHNDSDEDNYPDGKVNACAKDCEDYLQPGRVAVDY